MRGKAVARGPSLPIVEYNSLLSAGSILSRQCVYWIEGYYQAPEIQEPSQNGLASLFNPTRSYLGSGSAAWSGCQQACKASMGEACSSWRVLFDPGKSTHRPWRLSIKLSKKPIGFGSTFTTNSLACPNGVELFMSLAVGTRCWFPSLCLQQLCMQGCRWLRK